PNKFLQKYILAIKSLKRLIHNIQNNKNPSKLSPFATEVALKISKNFMSLKTLRKVQRIVLQEKYAKEKEYI
ncbi:3189_t:CDS:1, partial [Acaulospora morrowiae]